MAAGLLGKSLDEFQRLPRAERIGWLCHVEAEDLREQAAELRRANLAAECTRALAGAKRRRR
jgi:hypothetical protein